MKKSEFEINSLYFVTEAFSEKSRVLRVVGTRCGIIGIEDCVFFADCQRNAHYTGRLSEGGQFAKVYFSEDPDAEATVVNAANVLLTADGRG